MAVAEVVALRDPMVTTMTALSLFAAGAVTYLTHDMHLIRESVGSLSFIFTHPPED